MINSFFKLYVKNKNFCWIFSAYFNKIALFLSLGPAVFLFTVLCGLNAVYGRFSEDVMAALHRLSHFPYLIYLS